MRILRDGGELDVRPGVRQNSLAVHSQGDEIAYLRWERQPSALAYFDIDGRCYELVGARRRTGRRGIEAWWAGEAVARLDIGALGRAKRVATRSGAIYEFRRTGSAVVLERDGVEEAALTIGRFTKFGGRRYLLYPHGVSEEELGGVLGVVMVYMVWSDQNRDIAALGVDPGG